MLLLLTALSLFISTSFQTFSQAPATGCDAITHDGYCFSYFTSSGVNWFSARSECTNWGGNLATIHSSGEEDLLATIRNDNLQYCWIGLNKLEDRTVWRWADGSTSSFRNWEDGEPSNGDIADCVIKYWKSPKWDDIMCSNERLCYYCSTEVIPFQIQTTTSVITTDQTTLYENITIQCITEKDTQHVVWSYVDLDGSRSVLNSPTSLTTGVSTLSVSTDKPGYYSCQVTQQTGVSKTYGVRIRELIENNDLVFKPNKISRAIIIREGNTTIECKDLTQENLQISWINVSSLPNNHAVSFVGSKLVLTNNGLPPGLYVFECVATNDSVRKSLQLTVRFLMENSTLDIVQNIADKENATFVETLQAIEILQNLSIGIGDNNTAPNNDFETLVNASSGLIMNLERFSSKVSNDVIGILVDILSNLIAFDETRSNASTAPINDGKTGVLLTSLIQGVEIVGRISLVGLEGNVTERVFSSERVVLVSQRIPYKNGTSEFLTIPQSDSVEIFESVSIPGTVVRDLSSEEEFRYSIARIKVISNISNSNIEESLGSNLLSLTVSTEPERKKLTSPILLRFFTPKSKNQEARCVFLDIQNSTYVSNGLSLNSSDGNSTLCVSTHLTSFGVLIRSKPHPVEREESLALSIISYGLLSASLIALIISIIIFIVNGKEFFQVEMNRIYFNYALALALAIFIFLFGIQATTIHPIACGASVFLLHYFWLAVFSWSLCVSIEIIYLLWITALDRKNLFWFLLPFGWGLPVPIVVVSIAVRHKTYIQQPIEHCFLSYSEGLIWSFIGPILVLLFLNLIALIMACIKIVIVTRNLSEKRGTVSNWEVAKQSLINSSILFPVLGVPWIILPISLLVNSFHATTLFEWLFTIFNSPSGILFFVLCTLKYDFVRENIFKRKTGNSSNQKSRPYTPISNNENRRNISSKNTLPKPRVNSAAVDPTPFDDKENAIQRDLEKISD